MACTVHVRMELQIATPGVHHHRDAELGGQALGIAFEVEQRRRGRGEDQVEDPLPVLRRERA
jgi:hypothetical protein